MTDWKRHACGGLILALAGVETVLRPAGALWLEDEAALIVADLHFEKGSSYADGGQLLPPFDTTDTLNRLQAEVAATAPRVVVFLGDSFHDQGAEGRFSDHDVESIVLMARGRELIWILGNHDPSPPSRFPGECMQTLVLAGLNLVHEPSAGSARGEVAGHLHPCARVAGAGRRRRCFATDGERVILPAFGAYAGGLNVKDVAIASRLARPAMAGVLGAGRVHAVGWRSLQGD